MTARVYVAVGAGEDASPWGAGSTPEAARAHAVRRVNADGEWAGEDPWEGEDPQRWAANLAVVVIEGPTDAVRTVIAELLSVRAADVQLGGSS